MINFSTLKGLTIPEGVVVQIDDAAGNVLWKRETDNSVILEVEKITDQTYAAETTYTDEQFILLDIYPKTNGTVSVTYGGLTKTITDTSGVEEPNAQQVFFGTFNGVSDSVTTPDSGTLTIEGDYVAFGIGNYTRNKANSIACECITNVINLGIPEYLPSKCLRGCKNLTSLVIPNSVTSIYDYSLGYCTSLTSVTISDSVTYISSYTFSGSDNLASVTFANATGWYLKESATSTTSFTLDVTDPVRNATYLTDTYNAYDWYRE